MNANFVKYNRYTGQIVCSGYSSSDIWEQCIEDSDAVIEGECNLYTDYVSLETREVTPRPTITVEPGKTTILADGNDLFVLTGLPVPCVVKVDADAYEITDGEFGFNTILPGIYTVKVESFPYITRTWEVTAV